MLFEEYLAPGSSEPYLPGEILVRPAIATVCVQMGHLDAAERELIRCREINGVGRRLARACWFRSASASGRRGGYR